LTDQEGVTSIFGEQFSIMMNQMMGMMFTMMFMIMIMSMMTGMIRAMTGKRAETVPAEEGKIIIVR